MTVELLSRIQFAFTAAFHYLYPPLSIGLATILVMIEGTRLRTGNPLFHNMARFWTRVFALVFDLGVRALIQRVADDRDRRILSNAIGPVWDRNEAWLVTGGGALFMMHLAIYTIFRGKVQLGRDSY